MLMELSTLYLFLKSDVDAFFGVCEEFLVSVVLGQTIAPLYIETINSPWRIFALLCQGPNVIVVACLSGYL